MMNTIYLQMVAKLWSTNGANRPIMLLCLLRHQLGTSIDETTTHGAKHGQTISSTSLGPKQQYHKILCWFEVAWRGWVTLDYT
jgi:hypothetical protein